MSLNNTPSSERIHIGIFGKRNAGKSSVINAITGQDLAIVSDIKGTTTDPVLKSMELLPLGPVVLIDTPGLDDEGKLGTLRIKKAYQMLNKTDIAVLVVDGSIGMTEEDDRILTRIKEKNIPYVIVFNKMDLITDASVNTRQESHSLQVSAKERREAAVAVLEKVGLSHRMRHFPTQLSGGQCQRVAIARAIVGNPDIILADEPTGNLDSKMGAEVMELLHKLNKEDGRTIVMVTHNDDQAKQTSRTVRFFDGRQVM